jgi:sugar lactone lactonase YvrE
LHGEGIGALSATQIGKLVPTYQGSLSNAENYGCGFLRDGRLLTSDIGNQADGPADGQLVLWFPPLDISSPRYCKLDIAIGTAGGIYVDEQDRIYVTSARETPGVYRYTGPFPTSADAAGGCGMRDGTGAPLADRVSKELFIPADGHIRTPNAIARSIQGTFYVSSVLNGVIAEYDAEGRFLRRILQPTGGERLPYPSTGTPLGLGVDSSGNLYYADIAIVQDGLRIGPGANLGTVRRIRFVNGAPAAPETIDARLNFPDGIGVLQ